MEHKVTIQSIGFIGTLEVRCSCGFEEDILHETNNVRQEKKAKKAIERHKIDILLAACDIQFSVVKLETEYDRRW